MGLKVRVVYFLPRDIVITDAGAWVQVPVRDATSDDADLVKLEPAF